MTALGKTVLISSSSSLEPARIAGTSPLRDEGRCRQAKYNSDNLKLSPHISTALLVSGMPQALDICTNPVPCNIFALISPFQKVGLNKVFSARPIWIPPFEISSCSNCGVYRCSVNTLHGLQCTRTWIWSENQHRKGWAWCWAPGLGRWR